MTQKIADSYKIKGAALPDLLRVYAKKAYLIRDNEGVHLFDEKWLFVTTLKTADSVRSELANDSISAQVPPIRHQRPAHNSVPKPPEPELTGILLSQQVQLIIDRFQHAITLHGIHADFFFEHRLGRHWQERWGRIWQGDLSPLFEDTKEFLPGQDINTSDQGGLGTLKAALIHELYVNSTLTGRSNGEKEGDSGKNMFNLLLFVCQLNARGELDHIGAVLSDLVQMRLIDALMILSNQFLSKKLMLQRVHQKLVFDFKRGRDWPGLPTLGAVKSVLIYKLYENTNRLDRGDGTDMVRIVRELLMLSGVEEKG